MVQKKLLIICKKRLGIDLNETTADGKFTLREVECLGACVAPPVCQIGKKYYENLTPEKIDEILEGVEEVITWQMKFVFEHYI